MKIAMTGIDYRKASVEERERFALTQSRAATLAEAIISRHGAEGCLVLSTCNRTEIWCSGIMAEELENAYRSETGYGCEELGRLFISRSGMEAVRYLLELGCGLHSQILGEDQILTQIKDAVKASRERNCLDPVLETLFRLAITAGKKVKATVRLARKDLSVPRRAVELAEKLSGSLGRKRCLVIGNGEMGRLVCTLLTEAGAEVFMTLRQYKKKDAVVPKGCRAVPYEERYAYLAKTDLLFSATLSPHFTLEADKAGQALPAKPLYCFDLAVPRDIDPELRRFSSVFLYGLDDLGAEPACDPDERKKADELLSEYAEEFNRWYHFREFIPVVGEVSKTAAKLTAARLEKPFKAAAPGQKELLQSQTEEAARKSFAKLLYGLRDHLDPEHWAACLSAVQAVVDEWQGEEETE